MTLALRDIHVTVSDGPESLTILNGADLTVEPGEFVAVTGPSGSGKSTMVAVAGLLRRPQQGQVIIDGEDVSGAPDRRRAAIRRDQIGFIFQSANLFPSLTAIQQLELVAHLGGKVRSEDREMARQLLDTVGLGDRLGHRPGQLSGGERQRVAIARALMGNPSVVIADEPTASLDDERGREVMGLLSELTKTRQTATVVITHAPHQLVNPDRILELNAGTLRDVTRPMATAGSASV